MHWSDVAGRDVLIVGTGREGHALATLLVERAARVRAIDEREGDHLARWRAEWGDRVPVLAAPGAAELVGSDVAFVSPGVPPHAPVMAAIAAAGVVATSATAVWMAEHAEHTIGVTGSKGKSTTTALVHALATAHGVDAALGGNIGVPLLSLPDATLYAAELSSYQCSSLEQSPRVAVLTALFPEHLDWHGSQDAYYAAKFRLATLGAHRVVANAADPRLVDALTRAHPDTEVEWISDDMRETGTTARWSVLDGAAIGYAGRRVVALADLPLRGRHNARNAALALNALAAFGVDLDAEVVAGALRAFRPLEHRLDDIADPSGITFVDDSLSTSPFAAIAALESLDSRDVVLLLGGQDRGVDSAPLRDYLLAHPIAALVGLPDSGARLLADLADTGIRSELATDMLDAVARARALVPEGGRVLLSPAAPSYGRYRDFADRADDFRRAIAATSPHPKETS